MKLQEIRNEIDRIDVRITELVEKRMELAVKAGKIKNDIEDNERERYVYSNVKKHSGELTGESFIIRLFTLIMNYSKHLQEEREGWM